MRNKNKGGETGITRNALTRSRSFKVMNWLEEHREELGTMTRTQCAQRLTSEFKFPISPETVSNLLKDLEWGNISPWRRVRSSRGGTGEKNGDRIRLLARQILFLSREVERLYGLIEEQYNREGKVNPQRLAEIGQISALPNEVEMGEGDEDDA